MTQFWIDEPKNLWKFKFNSTAEIINSLSLIIIIITILISLALTSIKPFYVAVVLIAILAFIFYFGYNNETFAQTLPLQPQNNTPMILKPSPNLPLRVPTPENPFMNVPIRDYDKSQEKSNYERYNVPTYPTPQTEQIRKDVSNDFINGLFQDPNGKLWERQNSQRQYVSQPIGSVPNKSVEFATWLYSKDFVCKQGSVWDKYGVKYTDDSLVCNGFNVSVPSNNGRKNTM